MSEIQLTRARRLQIRLHTLFGHGYVTRVAGDLGLSRSYVSQVLNELAKSEPLLDRIEAYTDEQEHLAESKAA